MKSPIIKEGFTSIAKDTFTDCFLQKPPTKWNYGFILYILWALGVFIRYFILLPFRLTFFFIGTLIFIFLSIILYSLFFLPKRVKLQLNMIILQFYVIIWIASLHTVIRFHGVMPARKKGQIYVSNHTTLFDFLIINRFNNFATYFLYH
jgi:glycerol-3-phosphate O-acyltransferase 3/4